MSNATGFAEIAGSFIEAWADNLIEPYENQNPLLASAPFSQGQMMGGKFHWPVRVTTEGGITFTAPQLTAGDTSALPYVGARSGYTPDWQIEAPQIDGRSRVKYEAIARSMKSVSGEDAKSKKAVRAATKIVMEGLLGSAFKRAEALMLHGRRGLGQVNNNSSVVAASTTPGNELANPFDNNIAGFIVDIEFTSATWIEGIWIQSEGATFDLFANTAGAPSGTKLNTTINTALSGTFQNGLILTMVNPPTPQTGLVNGTSQVIRLFHSSGTAGGAGVGIIGGATFNQINASAHVTYESGGPASEFIGLTTMAQNTGTLFNVSGATYSVARGNTDAAVGNLKLADLVRRLSRPINKGARGKKIRAVVPTELFAQFANDEATLRRYLSSDASAKNGFGNLEMYLPHGGTLEILGHTLQKYGEVLCYVPEEVIRIGAQDISMIERGKTKDQLILEVAASPASEMRLYGQFAPLMQAPCHTLSLTGVTF